ncbi:MAG: HIT domain-containing protein [Anaerolineae bacterium]|nr:HIT domain-containing protein [Anaerolineae bacterium]
MDILWTPWRMEFILSEKPKECIFCTKISAGDDRAEHVLYRGQHTFIALNLYPYNNGHLLVAPYRHVPSTEDLLPEELAELLTLVNKGLGVLRRAMRPHGFNLGANLGKVAGAGVESHVHIHVVPRWEGDTNFMPLLAQTRVIPQWIDQTYDQLRQALEP